MKSLTSNWNQAKFTGTAWEASFVDEVKRSHPRSKVIWGQVLTLAENVKLVSIEKFTSNWNQTWFTGITWEASYHLQTATAGDTSGPRTDVFFTWTNKETNVGSLNLVFLYLFLKIDQVLIGIIHCNFFLANLCTFIWSAWYNYLGLLIYSINKLNYWNYTLQFKQT